MADSLDEQVVILLAHIFNDVFLPDEPGIAPENRYGVLPAYFFGWLQNAIACRDILDACAGEQPPEVWNRLVEVVNSGLAVEVLGSNWYTIVLRDRKTPPAAGVVRISTSLLVTFADGKIMHRQHTVPRELVPASTFNDAIAAVVVAESCKRLLADVVESGLPTFHEEAEQLGGDVAFETCMGCILKTVPEIKDEKLRTQVMKYMRLCQMMLRPPVPSALLVAAQARLEPSPPGSNRGGWVG